MRAVLALVFALSMPGGASWAADRAGGVVCPEDAQEALQRAAEAVESSFYALEQARFDLARHRVLSLDRCVDAPLTVAQAVALHRAHALISYVEDDLEGARRAFAAVHRLEPDWSPDPTLLPPEHALWRLYEEAVGRDEAPRMLALTAVPEHGYAVDGTRHDPPAEGAPAGDHALPADRAFVLQVFEGDGGVRYTGYHLSTANIPLTDLVVLPDPAELRRKRRQSARVAGSAVAGALLAGAAVTLGLGVNERAAVQRRDVPIADIDEVQVKANLLGYTSAGLAGAAALTTTLTWAVKW